jgi:hypothetical protein
VMDSRCLGDFRSDIEVPRVVRLWVRIAKAGALPVCVKRPSPVGAGRSLRENCDRHGSNG